MFPHLDIFPRFDHSGPAQQAGDPRPQDRLDVAWMARKKGVVAAESFGNGTCILCIGYKCLGAIDLRDWSPAFTAHAFIAPNDPLLSLLQEQQQLRRTVIVIIKRMVQVRLTRRQYHHITVKTVCTQVQKSHHSIHSTRSGGSRKVWKPY